MSSWGEYYHAIASQMALYRLTNQRLVEVAELRPGMSVLDLACGSGLTSLAALEKVPSGLKLFLADSSRSMVDHARVVVGDRAEEFYVTDAAKVPDLLPEKVDRVLCNMSLWYFSNPEDVLRRLRSVMKPTGRLCFNLSGTFFNTHIDVVSPQWALMRVLHRRGQLRQGVPDVERLPNQRSIEGTLHSAGFKPFFYEVQEIPSLVSDTEPEGILYDYLRLHPLPLGKDFQEAVRLSLATLPGAADEMNHWKPRWQVPIFMAQPAVDLAEILKSRLGKLPPQ